MHELFLYSCYLCCMEAYFFTMGILASVYFMLGIYFCFVQKDKVLFKRAFGWAMLVGGALVTIAEVVIYFYSNWSWFDYNNLFVPLDSIILPLYMFEISCIFSQTREHANLHKRLIMTILLELPIIPFTIASFYIHEEWYLWTVRSYTLLLGVMTLLTIIAGYNRYEALLKKESYYSPEISLRWINYILILYIIQGITWALIPWVGAPMFCLIISALTNLQHAYYIDKQKPIDIKELRKKAMEQEKELHEKKQAQEEQDKVINELKEIVGNNKKQVNLDAYFKAFNVEHPGFETKLQEAAIKKLTRNDIYLCTMIFQSKRSAEIGAQLGISQSSVEVARYRLRSKLALDKGDNLRELLVKIIES